MKSLIVLAVPFTLLTFTLPANAQTPEKGKDKSPAKEFTP